MNKTLLPVALAGALLASGCSVIPTLERPAAPVAAAKLPQAELCPHGPC